MPESKPEPLYNAARRLRFLAAFIVVAAAAFTGFWYFAAGRIDAATADLIARQNREGTEIDCPSRQVRGYPFRFGIFCDSLSVREQGSGAVIQAGAFRSAAQFYEPERIIAELVGPLVITPSAQAEPVTIASDNLRAAIHLAEPFPEHVSITSGPASVTGGNTRFGSAESAAFHVRTNPDDERDLDLAARLVRVTISDEVTGQTKLPLFDTDIDIAIKDGIARASMQPVSLGGLSGTLRRFALLLNDDAGVLVSGPYEIDERGNLSGEFLIRLIDADAVLNATSEAFPGFGNQLGLLAGMPRTGERGDEIELTLSIDNGRMRFGLIPLGTLPPLPPTVSL